MSVRVSTLSYNVAINTGTSLPFLIVRQKMFSSPVLAKINQGQETQISNSVIILRGYIKDASYVKE